MIYKIGNYTIEKTFDETLKIHYKRTVKDYFYIIIYFLICVPILGLCFLIMFHLFKDKVDSNTFFGAIIAICLFLAGIYFLLISFETMIKPISNVFLIKKSKPLLKIRLNTFKTVVIPFSEIKHFQLGANNIKIITYTENRKYSKNLYLLNLQVFFVNGENRKIHQFEGSDLLISFTDKKKNKSLKEVSRQVADLVSKECSKKYIWTGTECE